MANEIWENLHPATIELITDLKYQGGYYGWDRVAYINEILIVNKDNSALVQFEALAKLFGSPPPSSGLSTMDQYAFNLGEGPNKPKETFFGVSEQQIRGALPRRNRIRLSFLVVVIQALREGRSVEIVAPTM